MDLNDYLLNNNVPIVEGFTKQIPWQIDDLKILSKNAKTIMEIGFNAGHSSELFLESSTDTKILSFDLGFYNYVSVGKEYIDNKFPQRHTLILGDSRITVPKYIQDNPEMKFDFIFIDGGHEYPIASADILNCRTLANKDTIVVVDDTIFTCYEWIEFYNKGPSKAWEEGIANGLIKQLGSKDYMSGRGMSWGKYINPPPQ
jgi:hypothetical protein